MASAGLESRLSQSRARLLRAVAGVTEEQFKRRPAASENDPQLWCIAEVLAHLLATERIWIERIELALREDGAAVAASDPAQHQAQARAGRLAPVPQLIHGLLGSERDFRRLLERAEREKGFERTLNHASRGRISVLWMLETYAIDHEDEHAAQIEALRAVVGAKPVET